MRKNEDIHICLYDLLACLTHAADIASSEIANHHLKVTYAAYQIAEALALSEAEKRDLILAGIIHDIGAFSISERLAIIEEDDTYMQQHACRGAFLAEKMPFLNRTTDIIRFHHLAWQNGGGASKNGSAVPELSHLLHLADRIAVQIGKQPNIVLQSKSIVEKIKNKNGSLFIPAHVEAFLSICKKESFWLDIASESLTDILPTILPSNNTFVGIDEMIKLTAIFAYIIDFRNPFTAEHSTGVAAVARALAAYMGFSDTECKMIYVAGHLHDLGKLTVSEIILNKPDSLNKEEISVMRSHTYHTYRILQKVKGLETINEWASYHHEKLNGKGYPFHLAAKDLSTGSRIMAVADIFTAIMEDRPYRRGMPAAKAKSLLQSMVDNGSICKEVVAVTDAHFDQVNEIRKNAQNNTLAVYRNLMYQR